ncbi:hypothetical protein N0V88_007071 [Collariella sp. IMI 366227]|nr:hypothetical protein N0V88_007071 [Collariella sp. IMI 366227]
MLSNKQRQRKVRNMLLQSFPAEDSRECELWEHNRNLSPLLRLPPELRNRIYELVLSVGQVNVRFKKWEHRPRTRSNGQRYYETSAEGGFFCRVLDRDQNPWQEPRESKSTTTIITTERRGGMTLLSPVCRQLYHETVLLPFRLNAWSFESLAVMDRFVMKEKRLPLPHRRAIRVLYSPTPLPTHEEKYFGGVGGGCVGEWTYDGERGGGGGDWVWGSAGGVVGVI